MEYGSIDIQRLESSMIKIANKFALLVSTITFVMCMIGNISLSTSLIRTGIVFVGVLLAIYLSGQLLKLGLIIMTPQSKSDS